VLHIFKIFMFLKDHVKIPLAKLLVKIRTMVKASTMVIGLIIERTVLNDFLLQDKKMFYNLGTTPQMEAIKKYD